jgi:nucleoside-diphosphate-sugar epimerase
MSSVKAASDDPDGILTETVIPAPATPYGRSKLRAEAYIQSVPLPEGKSYYILRPCMIHGPGNKGNLNLLYKFVRKGIPYPLSAFDNRRSFLSVENLCFVIGALVSETGIPSGIYNVSDDEPLSTNEIVRTISASLGKKARLLPVSRQLIGFMARVGDGLHLPFTTNRLNKLVSDYVVSNSKLKMALNAELPLSSREGLLITLKSFQGNG